MIREIPPTEAETLLAGGDIDVIDVREADEYASGHVPGARNVPLADFKANPEQYLDARTKMFVCARGVRSMAAAQLAAKVSPDLSIYQLEGGTEGWRKARLSLEGKPAEAKARAKEATKPSAESMTAGDGEVAGDVAVDAVVGANLRNLRKQRGLSLDDLARTSGLSRSLLGQIELGKAQASVSVVWRIAQAFNVHFSEFLDRNPLQGGEAPRPLPLRVSIVREKSAKRLVSPDGRYSSRALYPFGEKPDAEFYELFLAAHSREDAEAHAPGTRENLIVTAGKLELHVGTGADAAVYTLEKGDAIVFTADVPHAYVNPSGQECWMYLVMTYRAG